MALQNLRAGFAKIQGEDFEYYVQSYSVVLGRNSKKAKVDLDLTGTPGGGEDPENGPNGASPAVGGLNISRSHARIFYDFPSEAFMLEVLGKNGVTVNGVMKPVGIPPVALRSQDLLQIGDRKFYFLLPAHVPDRPQQNGGQRKKKRKAKQEEEGSMEQPPQIANAVI